MAASINLATVIISTLTSRLASHRIQIAVFVVVVVTPFVTRAQQYNIPTRGFNKQCRAHVTIPVISYRVYRPVIQRLVIRAAALNGKENKHRCEFRLISTWQRFESRPSLCIREIRITNPRKIPFFTPVGKISIYHFFFRKLACIGCSCWSWVDCFRKTRIKRRRKAQGAHKTADVVLFFARRQKLQNFTAFIAALRD